MARFLGKFMLLLVAFAALCGFALVLSARARGPARYRAPYPELAASTDPAIVARGEYLARGPGHCIECHGRPGDSDPEGAFVGGRRIELPVGTFFVPNLTPDPETGIGRRSDRELARVMRHGVRADGRAALPFMGLAGASDEDLVALLSYLRSQPAVRHPVPADAPNAIGDVILSFVLAPPPPPTRVGRRSPEGDVARGEYLVHHVANCVGCHTRVDERTGERVGASLAGGNVTTFDGTRRFATPSLRPTDATGRVARRSEDEFVALFAAGADRGDASPMPWGALARMEEADVRAIHRYLAQLPSAEVAR